MTTLERRCGLLLRAYPAGYRQERGEEIVSTLLEATPAGRSWPLARDLRSLAIGGLHARAAVNQQRTTAANLRVAMLIGVSAYLASTAANDASFAAELLTQRHGAGRLAGLPLLVMGTLLGLAVTVAWVSSRRPVRLAAVMAAAIAVLLPGQWRFGFEWPVTELACLTALVLFAGRDERPGRGWLWPVALVVAWMSVAYFLPGSWTLWIIWLPEAVGVLSLLWVVIDARPAVAVAVFTLAAWLLPGVANLANGPDIAAALHLLIVSAVALLAVWRLRRQSGRARTA
jgi:hypothetical protein